MKRSLLIFVCLLLPSLLVVINAEKNPPDSQQTVNLPYKSTVTLQNSPLLNNYRLLQPASAIEFKDLDKDGDPDLMYYTTINGYRVLWIDDDDDMVVHDTEGDTDNDCLLIDMNYDGYYAGYGDVVIDWVDSDTDGKADVQLYYAFGKEDEKHIAWEPGLYMVTFDPDKDNIMNYIDFRNFKLRGWINDGHSNFFKDYSGNSLFLKIHASPEKINNVALNWENPFIFYDFDKDGLSEKSIRLLDEPKLTETDSTASVALSQRISYAAFSYDIDNDNHPKRAFDYDFSVVYRGNGFDYSDQFKPVANLRGLPDADYLFLDPRIRQLEGFIFPDERNAEKLVTQRGDWDKVWFVFDEDDDCERWERVELYEPRNPYRFGAKNGGLDNNPQADVAGDRGEWDNDNSGKGQLYFSPLDGKLHLYGAENGVWRVDQNAFYYQGMGGLYDGYGPGRSSRHTDTTAVFFYKDTDNNGFFDTMEFDWDGDTTIDFELSLFEAGFSDEAPLMNPHRLSYRELHKKYKKQVNLKWKSALHYHAYAQKQGINTDWYALLLQAPTLAQKQKNAFWIRFYLLQEVMAGEQKEKWLKNYFE